MAQYIGNTPSSTLLQVRRQTYTFTATSNQTVFSGTDGYSNVLATPNAAQVLIYIDGVLLEPHQYSVGLDFVTLNSGVTAGSEVVIFTELEAALINTYTIAESQAAISSAVNNIPLEQITNVDLATNGQQIGQTIIWDGTNFVPGDLFSQTDFDNAFAAKYTTDLAEGSNLYYTDARVGTYLTANSYATETFVSTSISTAVSNLIDTAPATLDTLNEIAAALGDDPNFATTITASIGTKLATADFTSTANTWLATKTSSDLTEGTNLYYTDARAQAAISTDATLSYSNGVVSMPLSGVTAGSYGSASTVPVITVDAQGRITSASTTNVAGVSGFSYTPSTNTYTITTSAGTSFDATGDLTSFDTGDLTEGTNLYYTDTRVGTYIGTITTNALTEGTTNLYYTDVRVSDYLANNGYDSAIAAKLNTADFTSTANTWLITKNTNSLSEGTNNLYYTDTRVGDYLTNNGYDTAANIVASIVDTAPTTLDTLNELAAALGDDPNFATTVTNAIGLKANTADLGTAAAENVEYFATAAQGALADSALQSVAFADLTSTPTTLAGYGITDAPAVLTDLGIVDGTIGQILTTDGAGGFTFEDAAEPLVVSGTAPSSPEEGALWFDNVTTGQLYAYVGTSWLSTAGLTTLNFSSVGDLSDVDITTSAPTAGQALIWDAVNSKFIPGESFSQSDFNTAFAANSTDDLSEGATNLYYTDARADARIALASSNYATAAQGALADSALQSVAFADLTSTPTTLAGYGITDAATSAQGALADTALQSVAFADLTSTPTTLAGYGITDAATSAQGALADTALQAADLNGYATETYVGTAISNLIDTAPTTLDTLNELAAALGDDPNFATTVTNSIGLKANTADLGTAAYEDVGYFATAAQGALADSALQSVAFADLTSTPTTISGYGITDAFDGAYSSLTGTPTTLAGYGITDAPASLTDLGIVDGTIGQILTTDGAGGFTFEDAAEPLVVSGTAPASPEEGALWFDNVTTGQLYAYVGTSWVSTAGLTTLNFSSVGDLSDVDITSVAPTDGQALVWDNATSTFIPGDVAVDFSGYATETYVNTAISTASSNYATAAQGALADTALQASDLTGYATETFVNNAVAAKDNTDEITEGSTNLYYTDARVETKIDAYVTGGTGVTVTSGEIAIGQDVSTTANVTFADITSTGSVQIDGDLTVSGTTVTINATNLAVEDNMIYLNEGSAVANPDLGIAGNYNDGTYAHAGVFRDATDGVWKFYDGYTPEPDASAYIDTTHASFNLASVQASSFIGNITGTVSSLSNHTTTDLSEGTNLYYTDARVGTYLTTNSYATETFVGSAITTASSNYATAAQGALADTALQSVAFADLTSTPTTLSGYGITDAPSILTDLSITDGTIGQVLTTDGAGGFTFEDVAGGATVSGTAPASPSEGDLWFDNTNSGQLYTYVGTTWLSTAGLSTLEFSSVGDLSDVDLATNAPTDGQALVWDSASSTFIPGDVAVDFTGYATETYVNTAISTASTNYATAAQGALADTALQAADLTGYATETYVNTAVSDLVAAAPAALDTLNELAAALGNDENFATTITNSIALKANSADLGTAAAQNVEYFATAAQGALADTALQSVAFGDLTSTPTTIAGYGITDAFDGAYSSLSGTPTIPSALTDLGITDGTIGQVLTTDGAGGFTFADAAGGASVVVSGTAPETAEEGDLWFDNVTTGELHVYENGAWLSTAVPVTIESINELGDVDITTTAPTDGQALIWDAINSKFVPGDVAVDLTGYATEIFVNTAISTASSNYATAAQGALADTALQSVTFADLGIADGTIGQVLTTDGAGNYSFADTAVAYGDSDVATYLSTNGFDTAANIVASIVDTAPTTLDTLNELAAALGDDPNFATTTAAAIGLKANTADLGTAAAQNVEYFATAAQGALADTALQSVAFADLTTTPTTLAGYGITDAFDGAYSSLTGTPTIPSVLTDLSIVDGTIGQVLTTDGAGGFTFEDAAIGGAIVSGTAPVDPEQGALWFDNTNSGQLYTYVGTTWLSTAGLSTLEFSSVGDLSDVDLVSNAPTEGQALIWDNVNSKFVPGDVAVDLTGYATETFVGTAISTASSNYATAAQGALADSALQSVAFSDLGIADGTVGQVLTTDGAGNYSFADTAVAYGDSDVATYLSSNGFDTASNIVASIVDTAPTTLDTLNELAAALGDDPNFATTTANAIGLKANTADLGTAAAEDVGYFATAAQGALADTALQSVAFADLTSTPTTLAGYGITDAPASLTDLGIVDGTVGQVLTTDGAGGFTFADASGGGGASITTSETAPVSPSEGDMWFNSATLALYLYYNDGDSTQWIQVNDAGGAAGNGLAIVSSTPPANPAIGDLWYDDASTGSLLIYNGSVWVSTASRYWVETSTTYDAVAGSKLFVDTSSNAVQVNLPASPIMGDEVYIVDAAGNSGSYNITVNRNGNKITGLDENLTIDVDGAAIILAYYTATRGWIVISK